MIAAVRRSGNNPVCAATRDVTAVTSAAGHVNGRVHSHAVAWTVAPSISTEWVCPPGAQQHHSISHIVPLHGPPADSHLQLSHGPPLSEQHAEVSSGQQEPQTGQATVLNHDRPLMGHEPAQSEPQQLPQLQQSSYVAGVLADDPVPTAAELQQQQDGQHQGQQKQLTRPQSIPKLPAQQLSHNQHHQRQLQQQQRPRALTPAADSLDHGSFLIRVANSTSADGLAQQLVNRLHQQQRLQRRQKHTKNQQTTGMQRSSSSSSSITLQCSSGASLYVALQAISLAALQAAGLQQPQQLLMQPQLVRNVLNTAADGKHGAGAYQLLLLWVPAAAPVSSSRADTSCQRQQQQRCTYKQADQPQKQHDNDYEQQHLAADMQAAACQGSRSPDAQEATAAAHASGRRQPAGTHHFHTLKCDIPAAAAPSQPKCKHKEQSTTGGKHNRGSSSSSSSIGPSRQLVVQSLSWRVSGLLRGGWPAELSCCSAAGALTAVKALVRARKQLAAGGMELLVAVHTPAAGVQGPAAAAVAGAGTGMPTVLSTAAFSVPLAVADADARARSSSASSRLGNQPAEVVRTSAAEQYLRQQQQERRKHKKLLSSRQKLQQQERAQQQQLTMQDPISMHPG